jgi:hypothetical protein
MEPNNVSPLKKDSTNPTTCNHLSTSTWFVNKIIKNPHVYHFAMTLYLIIGTIFPNISITHLL